MSAVDDRLRTQLPDKPRHFEGFDGLRLLAAISVIFSHAFLIARGSDESEPFVRLLGRGNIIGLYGVFTFFIISGFLLARSLTSNPSAITYTVNRVLRIFPGFLFCTLIVALVVGPLCSSLSTREYLSSAGVFAFVGTSLDTLGDAPLPGLYAYDGGTLAGVVNGSLWSLKYEALSYVFLLLLWTLLRSSGRVAAVITATAVLTWASPSLSDAISGIAYTLPYFAAGVVMHQVQARYGTTRLAAIACLVLLIAAASVGIQSYAFALFGAYLVVFVAERPNLGSRIAEKVGDCSYGLYLYGWPAEQIVKQLTLTTNPWALFVMTVPLAFAFALLSCHLIERPAMRVRTSAAARLRSAVAMLCPVRRPAVLGAKIAFVVGTMVILLSRSRSWYFLGSMSEVLLGVVVGSILVAALHGVARRFGVVKAIDTMGKA